MFIFLCRGWKVIEVLNRIVRRREMKIIGRKKVWREVRLEIGNWLRVFEEVLV